MTNKLLADLAFWFESEQEIKEHLEALGLSVTITGDKEILDYEIRDSQWNQIMIELKTRRCESSTYPRHNDMSKQTCRGV